MLLWRETLSWCLRYHLFLDLTCLRVTHLSIFSSLIVIGLSSHGRCPSLLTLPSTLLDSFTLVFVTFICVWRDVCVSTPRGAVMVVPGRLLNHFLLHNICCFHDLMHCRNNHSTAVLTVHWPTDSDCLRWLRWLRNRLERHVCAWNLMIVLYWFKEASRRLLWTLLVWVRDLLLRFDLVVWRQVLIAAVHLVFLAKCLIPSLMHRFLATRDKVDVTWLLLGVAVDCRVTNHRVVLVCVLFTHCLLESVQSIYLLLAQLPLNRWVKLLLIVATSHYRTALHDILIDWLVIGEWWRDSTTTIWLLDVVRSVRRLVHRDVSVLRWWLHRCSVWKFQVTVQVQFVSSSLESSLYQLRLWLLIWLVISLSCLHQVLVHFICLVNSNAVLVGQSPHLVCLPFNCF